MNFTSTTDILWLWNNEYRNVEILASQILVISEYLCQRSTPWSSLSTTMVDIEIKERKSLSKFISRQLIPTTFFSFKGIDFLWKEATWMNQQHGTTILIFLNIKYDFKKNVTKSTKKHSSMNHSSKSFCKCIQNPVKHLRGSILWNSLWLETVNYFCKTLNVRCLTKYWMHRLMLHALKAPN